MKHIAKEVRGASLIELLLGLAIVGAAGGLLVQHASWQSDRDAASDFRRDVDAIREAVVLAQVGSPTDDAAGWIDWHATSTPAAADCRADRTADMCANGVPLTGEGAGRIALRMRDRFGDMVSTADAHFGLNPVSGEPWEVRWRADWTGTAPTWRDGRLEVSTTVQGPRTASRVRDALRGRPVEIVPLVDAGAPDDTEYRVRVFAHQSTKRMLAENVKSTGSDYGYATSTAGFLEPSERPLARRLSFERTLFMPPSVMATSTISNMPTQTRNVPANPRNPTGRLTGKWLGRTGATDACEVVGAMFVGDDGTLVSCEVVDPADPTKGHQWQAATGTGDTPVCSPDRVWDTTAKRCKCRHNPGSLPEPADGSCFQKAGTYKAAGGWAEACPAGSTTAVFNSVRAPRITQGTEDGVASLTGETQPDRSLNTGFECIANVDTCQAGDNGRYHLRSVGIHLRGRSNRCETVRPESQIAYLWPRNDTFSMYGIGDYRFRGGSRGNTFTARLRTGDMFVCANGRLMVRPRGRNFWWSDYRNRKFGTNAYCVDFIPIFTIVSKSWEQTRVPIRSYYARLDQQGISTTNNDRYWSNVAYRPTSFTGLLSCDPLPNSHREPRVAGFPVVAAGAPMTDAPRWCMFHIPRGATNRNVRLSQMRPPGKNNLWAESARPVTVLSRRGIEESAICNSANENELVFGGKFEPDPDGPFGPDELRCLSDGKTRAVKNGHRGLTMSRYILGTGVDASMAIAWYSRVKNLNNYPKWMLNDPYGQRIRLGPNSHGQPWYDSYVLRTHRPRLIKPIIIKTCDFHPAGCAGLPKSLEVRLPYVHCRSMYDPGDPMGGVLQHWRMTRDECLAKDGHWPYHGYDMLNAWEVGDTTKAALPSATHTTYRISSPSQRTEAVLYRYQGKQTLKDPGLVKIRAVEHKTRKCDLGFPSRDSNKCVVDRVACETHGPMTDELGDPLYAGERAYVCGDPNCVDTSDASSCLRTAEDVCENAAKTSSDESQCSVRGRFRVSNATSTAPLMRPTAERAVYVGFGTR